jgi:hypothetical protein
MFLAFLALQFASAEVSLAKGIVESITHDITYEPHIYNDHIALQNVVVKPNMLYLRSGVNESSVVRWDVENEIENFSFAFRFNKIHMETLESSGIYMYYTEEKQTIGNFKGAQGTFNGFMVGLEFNGKSVDIVFAKNNGKDYEHIGEYVSRTDSLDPKRFRNVEELTMKVVCTQNNFKVELYDGEKILYDNFRIYRTKEKLELKKNMHISIVADYQNVASSKSFVLKEAQLYERKESGEYNMYDSHMEKYKPTYRNKEEIHHSNDDIRELIHRFEMTQAYIKKSMGELSNTKLSAIKEDLTKDLTAVNEKLDKIENIKKAIPKKADFATRLNEFEIKIMHLQRSINEFDFIIENLGEKQKTSHHLVEYAILGIGSFGLLVLGVKELINLYDARNKIKINQ